MYSTLKGFWQFYVQETSVLDSCFIQFVVLPDDWPVRPEICTCRSWWL